MQVGQRRGCGEGREEGCGGWKLLSSYGGVVDGVRGNEGGKWSHWGEGKEGGGKR